MSYSSVHLKGYVPRALLNYGLGTVTRVVVNPFSVWVISFRQPTALWWLLPSQKHASHTCQSASPPPTPFRWKSTPQSHHTYIYVLTDTLTNVQTHKHMHTHTVHIYRRRSHYGDKSCLSWLPSVSHGVVCCTSQTPPSSAFHRWICGVSKGLSGGYDCRTVWIQTSCDPDREQTHTVFSKLWGVRGATLQQRGQVNHHGLTVFNPLNHEFTPT